MLSILPILKVQIQYENDVVIARQRARSLAEKLKFDGQDQIRIATAVSELARNVFQYAGRGSVEFLVNLGATPQTLMVVVKDKGPGIANLQQILRGQYVSKTGMGVGLMGAKKLVDTFAIASSPEEGTQITLSKNLPRQHQMKNPQQVTEIADSIGRNNEASFFDEIRQQNQDLIQALDQLREKQEELSNLNQELSETNRGVVALYAELDEKALSLQKANEIKTSFLSNMTHEFRTPLTSIMSLSRLLLDRLDGDLTEEQERQVRYIRQSAENLLELVSDLLDLAKVEAGKISLKPADFDLPYLFGALRGVFRPLLPAEGQIVLDFQVDSKLTVHSDEGKLGQILRNLISNALKYTEKGSVVVSGHLEAHDEVVIQVKDTGIGIAPEHLSLIFKDFTQIDSNLQRRSRGTGLGLPLSKKLAQLLGGDITVESEVNRGSTFTLRIPRLFAGESEPTLFGSHRDETSASEESLILIVDPDEASRYVLKSTLSALQNFRFQEFETAENAQKFISESCPKALFMELSLPDVNGFEWLRTLRANNDCNEIPIFINTARILSMDEKDILEQLTSGVISKSNLQSEESKSFLREALKEPKLAADLNRIANNSNSQSSRGEVQVPQ